MTNKERAKNIVHEVLRTPGRPLMNRGVELALNEAEQRAMERAVVIAEELYIIMYKDQSTLMGDGARSVRDEIRKAAKDLNVSTDTSEELNK